MRRISLCHWQNSWEYRLLPPFFPLPTRELVSAPRPMYVIKLVNYAPKGREGTGTGTQGSQRSQAWDPSPKGLRVLDVGPETPRVLDLGPKGKVPRGLESLRTIAEHSQSPCGHPGHTRIPHVGITCVLPMLHVSHVNHVAIAGRFPMPTWPLRACYPSLWGHLQNIPRPTGCAGRTRHTK